MIATSRAAMLRAAMSTASGSGGEICCSVGAASVPLAGLLDFWSSQMLQPWAREHGGDFFTAAGNLDTH